MHTLRDSSCSCKVFVESFVSESARGSGGVATAGGGGGRGTVNTTSAETDDSQVFSQKVQNVIIICIYIRAHAAAIDFQKQVLTPRRNKCARRTRLGVSYTTSAYRNCTQLYVLGEVLSRRLFLKFSAAFARSLTVNYNNIFYYHLY
jgi:hypothetical protein